MSFDRLAPASLEMEDQHALSWGGWILPAHDSRERQLGNESDALIRLPTFHQEIHLTLTKRKQTFIKIQIDLPTAFPVSLRHLAQKEFSECLWCEERAKLASQLASFSPVSFSAPHPRKSTATDNTATL